jgi:hypothetical protein
MKQFKITLTEEQWNQFESLIGELPTKFGVPLLNIINPNLQSTEKTDPQPIGGGGGAGAPKPKPIA